MRNCERVVGAGNTNAAGLCGGKRGLFSFTLPVSRRGSLNFVIDSEVKGRRVDGWANRTDDEASRLASTSSVEPTNVYISGACI